MGGFRVSSVGVVPQQVQGRGFVRRLVNARVDYGPAGWPPAPNPGLAWPLALTPVQAQSARLAIDGQIRGGALATDDFTLLTSPPGVRKEQGGAFDILIDPVFRKVVKGYDFNRTVSLLRMNASTTATIQFEVTVRHGVVSPVVVALVDFSSEWRARVVDMGIYEGYNLDFKTLFPEVARGTTTIGGAPFTPPPFLPLG